MPTTKQVLAYLKDNPNKYWFKRKLYGWGWVPVTWQGWLAVGILVAFLVLDSVTFSANPTGTEAALFLIEIALAVGILIMICYIKGEKPAWKWGFTEEEKQKYGSRD